MEKGNKKEIQINQIFYLKKKGNVVFVCWLDLTDAHARQTDEPRLGRKEKTWKGDGRCYFLDWAHFRTILQKI